MRRHLRKREERGTRQRQSFTGRPWEGVTTRAHLGSQVLRRQKREPWALGNVPSVDGEGRCKTGAVNWQELVSAGKGAPMLVSRQTPGVPHAGR
jgi:hypothetical protein